MDYLLTSFERCNNCSSECRGREILNHSIVLNSGRSSLYPDMDNHLIPHDIQLDFIKDQAVVAKFEYSLFRYTETVE